MRNGGRERTRFLGEIDKELHGLGRNPVLGVVQDKVVEGGAAAVCVRI